MANLNIRNLPDEVHQALRLRAARAGRSMEAEARAILTQTCIAQTSTNDLRSWVDDLYHGALPTGVVEDLIREFFSLRNRAATRYFHFSPAAVCPV